MHQTHTHHRSNIELANQFYRTLTVVLCANHLLLNVEVGPTHQKLNVQVSHFISRQHFDNDKQKYVDLVVLFFP